ncbi:hypothetical protein SEVIR_6G246100v4 [Setaria viridis]|uniref:Uncharacterized protein n=1 Tax=Setaria viridis TaxID=4556 RepID=A0A4U6U7G1_SETVI|nr:hypothetical protein SEVIR_6G246100v2 [Setaria viridis]
MVLVASRLLNADDDRRGKTETKPLCIMRAAEQLKVTRRGTDGEGLRKHGVRTWELHPPTKPNQTSPDKMGVNFMAIRLVSDDLVKTRERGTTALFSVHSSSNHHHHRSISWSWTLFHGLPARSLTRIPT